MLSCTGLSSFVLFIICIYIYIYIYIYILLIKSIYFTIIIKIYIFILRPASIFGELLEARKFGGKDSVS